jgi:hypothetical protein
MLITSANSRDYGLLTESNAFYEAMADFSGT